MLKVMLIASGFLLVSEAIMAAESGNAGIEPPIKREQLLKKDIPDMPGKRLNVITVEYAAGAASPAHQHPGSVFAYVLRGSVISQLDGVAPVTYTTGQGWYEGPMTPHRMSRNASTTEPAKILVFLISTGDETVTVPLK